MGVADVHDPNSTRKVDVFFAVLIPHFCAFCAYGGDGVLIGNTLGHKASLALYTRQFFYGLLRVSHG